MMTNARAADSMMKSVRAVVSMTTNRVSAVSVTMTVHVAALTTTDRVEATAVSKTVRAVVSRTKKSRAVAARAMFARKTRCTTVRKPLAKSALTSIWPTVASAHAAKPTTSSRPVAWR
jgi:hypothetical protein